MSGGSHASQPSFSVVVAAYQAAAFIGGAVASALEQEPPPHEVIVGDDGSTDDLRASLAPFGAAVKLVRIEHGGEGAAKNAAAAAATGDFLAFLDADDRFLPGRIAAMGELARHRPDLDVITTDVYLTHGAEVLGRVYGPGHSLPADQRAAILQGNFVIGLSAVRRSRFAEVGGFDTGVAYTVDWELWMRLILSGSQVGLVPEPLAEYRLHPDSMSVRRAEMSRGRLDSIARAEARSDLSRPERALLQRTRKLEEARLARERLKETLLAPSYSGARAAAAAVVFGRQQPLRSRLKSTGALVVPILAAGRLREQERTTFVSVGDRRLPRAP